MERILQEENKEREVLPQQKPPWLRVRAPGGPGYLRLRRLMRDHKLHTVCEEAKCPNIGECWEEGTATFLILGDTCTRRCGFCAIKHGLPTGLDLSESERVAETVELMDLQHAVITSVNRDDLKDGGASTFAAVIRGVRERVPGCTVEVLIPDFKGSQEALLIVLEARPDILNHNIETVPRLYGKVRPGAKYERSIELLARAKTHDPALLTKSGLILGFGEEKEELLQTMQDLRGVGCDILTLGQYLRPTALERHLPVVKYYTPEEFQELRVIGEGMGFGHVEAGPLVRSSYHAGRQARQVTPSPIPDARKRWL